MNIFDPEVIKNLFINYYLFFVVGVFLVAFICTYYLIPKVLWIAREKELFKPVIGRSAHKEQTPTFGGVAFFTVFVLVLSILQSLHKEPTGNHLIAAVTLTFMVGLKDDLVVSTAWVKLLGQLLATGFIVFSPELQITGLHGFLGIEEIPAFLGYGLAAFMVIAAINSYNLIDGINGLAGIVGIIVASFFAVAFHLTEHPFFMMISLAVDGILVAYLRFNFSKSPKQIFMGDSGSLIIGLILGALSVKLLSISAPIPIIEPKGESTNRILFLLAVLFIPVFDTARVMLVRLYHGGSPFEADGNHTHHILLRCGMTHMQSSIGLGLLNIAVIVMYYLFSRTMSSTWVLLSTILLYLTIFAAIEYWNKKMKEKLNSTSA